jgi:uncharacterized protein YndB with AHSA1/START domain
MATNPTDRIEKKVLLKAPRARVWRALTDATEFGQWFGVDLAGSFSPGTRVAGKISAMHKGYEGLPFEITIERMEPERLFSYRWHPNAHDPKMDYSAEPTTLVVFQLEETENGTLLTVVESGFDRIPLARRAEAYGNNDQGWAQQMKSIERHVSQGS